YDPGQPGQPYDQGQPFTPGQPQAQPYAQGRPPAQPQPYAQAGGYGTGMGDQHTQVWDPAAQQAGWPPAPPGNQAFVARQRESAQHKGFVSSLFDFGFNSYVTPKVIKGLYLLATLWTILVAIFLLLVIFNLGGVNAGIIIFALI